MNLRYVVPALGLAALSATSASAQEIAKGVTLDGYVDTIFTATANDTDKDTKNSLGSVTGSSASTTDFSSEGVLMVGWAPTDRISGKISTRSGNATDTLNVVEAWGSVKATEQLTVSSGKSYGPYGYYSPYATGVNFVTGVLSTKLYTVNPVGVWATYTANDKLSATVIVADTFFGGNKANRPSSVSPGIDVVFNPTPELSLNLEAALDPNGGGADEKNSAPVDPTNKFGSVYYASLNAQFKKDALTAAGELLYQVVENKGKVAGKDDQANVSYAVFVTYALSGTPFPMAVTGQLSGYMFGDSGTKDSVTGAEIASGNFGDSGSKAQLVLLTNPLTVSQFGLNYELFALSEDTGGKADVVNSVGVAIEGLYVIP